jgi:dihydrofolate reductase
MFLLYTFVTVARKLVYYVACTIDGFIGREDGSFDFFPFTGEHFADLIARFPETFPLPLRKTWGIELNEHRFDTVLMGRNTYEVGLREGITSPYSPLRQLVLSRSMPASPDPAVDLHRGDPVQLVRQLKASAGQDIWLCGGSKLAGALIAEIDELILKINPIVLGAGMPLFAQGTQPRPWRLLEHKVHGNGFVLARYEPA